MSARKNLTRIIIDESMVPEGFVPLTSVTSRATVADRTFLRSVSDAHMKGEIRAVKLVRTGAEMKIGRVWVNLADFEAWRDRREKEAAQAAAEPTPTPEQVQAIDGVLRDPVVSAADGAAIVNRLDRLIDAFANLQAAIELQTEGRGVAG